MCRLRGILLFFQELLSRTSLETQKLDLMGEVSDLKIKLVGMEKEQIEYEEKQNKAEVSLLAGLLMLSHSCTFSFHRLTIIWRNIRAELSVPQ